MQAVSATADLPPYTAIGRYAQQQLLSIHASGNECIDGISAGILAMDIRIEACVMTSLFFKPGKVICHHNRLIDQLVESGGVNGLKQSIPRAQRDA